MLKWYFECIYINVIKNTYSCFYFFQGSSQKILNNICCSHYISIGQSWSKKCRGKDWEGGSDQSRVEDQRDGAFWKWCPHFGTFWSQAICSVSSVWWGRLLWHLPGWELNIEGSSVGRGVMLRASFIGTVQDFLRLSFSHENVLPFGLNLADNTSTFYPFLI